MANPKPKLCLVCRKTPTNNLRGICVECLDSFGGKPPNRQEIELRRKVGRAKHRKGKQLKDHS